MNKPRRKIPRGAYCYKIKSVNDDGSISINSCPYWSIKNDLPEHMNGYCKFMGISDFEMEGVGLLWDSVKECGVKL